MKPNIIVLDFDDTIHPTTLFMKQPQLKQLPSVRAESRLLDAQLIQLYESTCKHTHWVILTGASRTWIDKCMPSWLPRMYVLLVSGKIHVLSAMDTKKSKQVAGGKYALLYDYLTRHPRISNLYSAGDGPDERLAVEMIKKHVAVDCFHYTCSYYLNFTDFVQQFEVMIKQLQRRMEKR